jgi:spore coat polysaccharide biosynthesis protein SpsF
MRNIACIIARTNSSRLPRKVLKEIGGVKMIEYIIRKIKRAKLVDEIYICTSTTEEDNVLIEIAKENGVKGYAGSLESIIDRMLEVGQIENADNVIRITADNIFTDEIYLDLMLKYHEENKAEYTRVENLPVGITSEVINLQALKKCYAIMNPNESQYLMLYMFQPSMFKCLVLLPADKHNRPNMTFTVDTTSDFERTKKLIEAYPDKLINLDDILNYCSANSLDNIIYKSGSSVKFPANLEFTFMAFRTEMDARLDASEKVYLQKDEYK